MTPAQQAFTDAATAAGFAVNVTWLPNPGGDADAWKNTAFRFEATITHGRKPVLTTPYYAGTGHATYKGKPLAHAESRRADVVGAVAECVRLGKPAAYPDSRQKIQPPTPGLADVLGSLCMDDPGDSPYAEWCDDYGYDTDSRKALATYQAIQDNTTRLRRAAGSAVWASLCELAREL